MSQTDHGPLADEYRAQASNPHGPHSDEGYRPAATSEAHGKLFDLFPARRGTAAHGRLYDEFGWKDMPAKHGQNFDSDFGGPVAHDGEHGTWFDAFRGGAQVRYLIEGAEYEGVVIDVTPLYAKVQSADGQLHEVGLGQFLQYRSPSMQNAGTVAPPSQAEAPSAHSASASGGQITDARATIDPQMETPFANKSVEKGVYTSPTTGSQVSAHRGVACGNCGSSKTHVFGAGVGTVAYCNGCKQGFPSGDHLREGQSTVAATQMGRRYYAEAKRAGALEKTASVEEVAKSRPPHFRESDSHTRNCGTCVHMRGEQCALYDYPVDADDLCDSYEAADTGKSVDATETALQGEGAKVPYCKRCKHVCREVRNGKCPTCGGGVAMVAPNAIGKTLSGALDAIKDMANSLDVLKNYEDKLSYQPGEYHRVGFGNQYSRQTQVFHEGNHIGTLHSKSVGKGLRHIQSFTTSVHHPGAVMGHNVQWLMQLHQSANGA